MTTTPTSTLTAHELPVAPGVDVRLTEGGTGRPVLVLHGGGGLPTVLGLAAHLAEHAHVLAPTHPGWDGTSRPETVASIADIAALYSGLLQQLDLHDVASQGYCFQVDLAWRALRRGLRVAEVPITFVERERGVSKMSGAIVREALVNVTAWGIAHRGRQLRGLVGGRPHKGAGRTS